MHLGENVPRNAPRARNEDDRGETGEEDDARGGKEDRQMRLPAEEEAAAPRHAPSRIVLLASCAVIVRSVTGPSE